MGDLKSKLLNDGFVVVPDFLPREMVEDLRQTSRSVLENLPAAHREKFRATGSLCNFGDHPEFANLVAFQGVNDVFGALGIDSYAWLAGYLISKPGKAPPLFWHQDWWGWSEDISYGATPLGLGFMYYLTDTSPENGCLRVIPGTHRTWHELHDLPEAHGEELSAARDIDTPAFRSHPDEIAVPVRAGDLVLMDSRLLHSAYANSTNDERSLLTLWYLPDFADMPQRIKAQLQKIFLRQDLDIDASDTAIPSPVDWPERERKLIEPLFPIGDFGEHKRIWARRPEWRTKSN